MKTKLLEDESDSFTVSVHEATRQSPVVLFAVGAGGQPGRYSTLLAALTGFGCTVIAPHFKRLTLPMSSEADLTLRARRLSLALDAFVQPGAAVAGVGHSIGASMLLALAGGQMWLQTGQRINIAPDPRLARLALLAPPTGFFQAPAALDDVRVPILAWVGTEDDVTPPAQTRWLAHALRDSQTVDVRVTTGAGHFSFMDNPPPNTVEPHPDQPIFLREYSSDVCQFLAN